MKRKATKILALCIMTMALCIWPITASAATVYYPEVQTPASGNVFVGVEGAFTTAETDAVLARVNAIRKEAAEEQIESEDFKVTEYVPVKWSTELEKMAQMRAAEGTVLMEHARPIGGIILGKQYETFNNVRSYSETLAWNYNGMMGAIEQWYDEKEDLVNKTGGVTGHYESLINPSYKYIGFGTFQPASGGWCTTCGEYTVESGLTEDRTGITGNCIQLIEVPSSDVSGIKVTGTSSIAKGKTSTFKMTAAYGSNDVVFPYATWTSSNTAVATVSSAGVVTGVKAGTATITAKSGSYTATLAVTVSDTAKTEDAAKSGTTTNGDTQAATGTNTTKQTQTAKSIAKAKVSSIAAKIYTGKALKPSFTVKLGTKKLVKGTDYTVAYSNNKNVGKAKVTITGKGKYTGKITKTFKINPKGTSITKVTKAKKAFTVKWKKQSTKMKSSRITGYQIKYSTKKSMANAKKVKVKGYAKVSKKISKLKGKKKYYVQVRTYKTVKGTTYYSKWSAKKSVITKK